MDRINFHHLLYFWMTVREGTVSRASAALRLAQPTLSAQIRTLERAIGHPLFRRQGRRLELTEVGRVVHSYADEIFSLGRELTDVLAGRVTGKPLHLRVGVADAVPKRIAFQLIEPAIRLAEPVRLAVREDRVDRLLAALVSHDLDLVISDTPAGPGARVRVFNHLLGECGTVLLAAPRLARRHRRGFPRSLDGAPFLLPAAGTAQRRALDEWLERHRVIPIVAGEIEDSALLKAFGEAGVGIFAAPAAIARAVCRQHGVAKVGIADGIRERFYAISAERRLAHPAVVAISNEARRKVFAAGRRAED